MVFAGDSVTRYQYMNLAYFLSKMKNSDKYGDRPGHPSLSIEKEWKSFEQFYSDTTAILGDITDGCGWETCDCHRDEGQNLATVREYRSLDFTFPGSCAERDLRDDDDDIENHLTLSYEQVFSYPDAVTAGHDALTYYERSHRQQPPNIFVFNMGLHMAIPDELLYNQTLGKILQKGQALVTEHNTTLIWKTTTPNSIGPFFRRNQEMDIAGAHNFKLFDVGAMALAALEQHLQMSWDDLHYFPSVYQQFNDVLLNLIC